MRRTLQANRVVGGLAALGLGVSLIAGAPQPAGAETDVGTGGDMTLAAQHPWAAAQPTSMGRAIVDLEVHEGRVWAGYGDYGANTGPITLASYDAAAPERGFDEALTVDTEAIYNVRSIGDDLVAPATDPRASADYAVGEPWAQHRPLRATHVYDSTSLTGEDLWLVGSKGPDAVAWRSMDAGITWAEELRVSPSSGEDGDFTRFYFAATANGRLYVQAVSRSGGPAETSLVFDGQAWTDGPDLLPAGGWGWKPQPFGDGFVYHAAGHGYSSSQILYFDGRSSREVAIGADVEVHAGVVWMLDNQGNVLKSADTKRWVHVGSGPTDGRSLAVTENAVYVGDTASQLWTMTTATSTGDTSTGTEPEAPDTDDGRADPVKGDRTEPGRDTTDFCPAGWERRGRC